MTTLTKLEKELLELLLPYVDGDNSFAFTSLEPMIKKLGWEESTAKGIISSLIKKQIICPDDDGLNKRPIFFFTMTVNDDDERMSEHQKEEINTVEKMEKFLIERGVA